MNLRLEGGDGHDFLQCLVASGDERLDLLERARHPRRQPHEAGLGQQERVLDADADVLVLRDRRP